VVLGRHGEIRPADSPTGLAQPIERLWAGDFVQEMEVDVKQVWLTHRPSDEVGLPDLLGQRAGRVAPCGLAVFAHARPRTSSCGGAIAAEASRRRSTMVHMRVRNGSATGLISRIARRQYQRMDNSSGVGVLDKAARVLSALEAGPATLAALVAATGLARPTAHRLAVALEHHRLVARDMQGRFILGPRLSELASAAGEDRLLAAAAPVLAYLRDVTGESAQLYRRQGDLRVCVSAAERMSGLRDTVPVGSALPMTAGSGAQILLAWEEPDRLHRGLQGAKFTATTLAGVRRRGWAQSVAEREPGVASVSAPVRGPSNRVVAAVSVSGPIERLSRAPGRLFAPAVLAASERLTEALRRANAA
jgi:DNA-binding IclR family transcriptional regulator